MNERNERSLALAGLMAIVWLVLNLILCQTTHLLALLAIVPYVVVALFVCLVVYLRERLTRVADDEKRDTALARQERADTALFEPGPSEPFTASRTREQYERFVIPVIAPLLALLQGYWAWRLYRTLGAPTDAPAQRLLGVAFLAAQAFTFFLGSRYLLGLSRDASARSLRGAGVALGVASFAALLAMVAALIAEAGYLWADRVAALILIGFLGILAVESLLNFIGECYRPRQGRDLNRAYESRLGGLLTDPGTWAKNVAQALDYQFGFKVSETWLYRFLENALLPLLIFQLLVLYLLSCLVFLGPDEEAILERFGKPVANGGQLESGLHLKWPWPFETVRRFPAKRVLTLMIGHGHEEGEETEKEPTVILWTVPHTAGEEQFLVAQRQAATTGQPADASVPVNLLAFHLPVAYRITNVYAYAYHFADPKKVAEQIAYRALTTEMATHGLFDVMGAGQQRTAAALRQQIQAQADRLQLGIEVVFVGLEGVHPPVAIADAFEAVIGATEEKGATVLAAHADAIKVLSLAQANAAKAGFEAEAYTVRRTAIADADAQRFLIQLQTQEKSPRVFRTNLYLDALRTALSDTRKYIITAAPAHEMIQFNFEEKLRPELFDLGPAPEKKQE